jgi:integrase
VGRRAYGSGSIWTEPRRGYEVWVGQVRVAGQQRQKVLGRVRMRGAKAGMTRAKAERELREFRAQVDSEIARPAVSGDASSHGTLADVGDRHCRHLETVMNRRPQTVQDYRIMLRLHLVPYFDGKQLDAITVHDVETFMHEQIKTRGLAHSTVANQVNLLHAIFKTAMKAGIVHANPVSAADKPRIDGADADLRFLSIEEVEALLRACGNDDLGRLDRVLFLTAAMTGTRQGELIALRWRDVAWAESVIRVRQSYTRGRLCKPKSRRSERAVPMGDRVLHELAVHQRQSMYAGDDDLVFAHPHTGTYIVASTLLDRFHDTLERAQVRKVRFHDLRHTFATHVAASGESLRALQAWMGHADIQTTMIYADYAPDKTGGRATINRAFAPPVDAIQPPSAQLDMP